jgi:periplasmic protein TonB
MEENVKYQLPSYSFTHIAAIVVAGALHVGLAAWAMQPELPVVISQNQIIQVSMVAPTIIKEKKVEPKAVKKKTAKVRTQPTRKGMVNLKEQEESKVIKKEELTKQITDDLRIQQTTSGLVSQNSTKLNSAITKPIAASYLNNPPPSYPEKARLRRQQGTVLLDIRVKTDGKPRSVAIAKSSGYNLLDKAALSTVRLWEFVPARRGSRIIEANVEVPITFQIN